MVVGQGKIVLYQDPEPELTRFKLAQLSNRMTEVRRLKEQAQREKEEAAKREDTGTMTTMEMLVRRCENTLLEYHLEWNLLSIDNVPFM
jgi:hypothetical protein